MPRVVRRAVIVIDSCGTVRKLHCVRLAHEDHAGRCQLAHHRAVLLRNAVRTEMGAGGRGHAFYIEEIFRSVGNAVQGAQVRAALRCTFGGVRLRQRALRHDPDERAQPAIERIDPAKELFGDFHRAEAAAADAFGEAGD